MDSFGEYLKRERELRGVTLEEIANATNIGSKFFIAIENDDDDKLPAEVFLKGFIRSYAKCIGIDPNEVILAYEEWITRKKGGEEGEKGVNFLIKGKWKTKRLSWVLSVILVSIGIILYIREGDQGYKGINKGQLLTREGIIVDRVAPIEGEMDEMGEVNGKDIMVLSIIALEDAWFRIEIDDMQVMDFVLPKGGREFLKAKEKFVMTIGNKDGTSLRLNGKEIVLPPSDYNVVRNFILSKEEIDKK